MRRVQRGAKGLRLIFYSFGERDMSKISKIYAFGMSSIALSALTSPVAFADGQGREVGRCEMTVCTKHENNYGGGTCVAYKTVPMFTLELLEDGYIRVLNTDPRPTVVIEAKPEFKLWTTISSMRIGNPYEGHGISISYYLELPDNELTFPKKNMLGYTILPGYLNPSTTCTIYEDLGFLPYKKPH
jgi:hypothetical protein